MNSQRTTVFSLFSSLYFYYCDVRMIECMFFSADVCDVSVRSYVCVRVYELDIVRRFVDSA